MTWLRTAWGWLLFAMAAPQPWGSWLTGVSAGEAVFPASGTLEVRWRLRLRGCCEAPGAPWDSMVIGTIFWRTASVVVGQPVEILCGVLRAARQRKRRRPTLRHKKVRVRCRV